MLNCYTSSRSVYFEGGFNPSFRKRYNGVIVRGICLDDGCRMQHLQESAQQTEQDYIPVAASL